MIEEIKETMKEWYSFDLTTDQINEYLNTHDIECFDTVERENYVNFIALKLTGFHFPVNTDKQDYKDQFYKELEIKAKEKGYIWKPAF